MIGYGPHKRKERPGVPQDHFVRVPWNNRFTAVDHRGRVTALVANGPETDTLERTAQEEFNALPEDERAGVLAYALDVARAFAEVWWLSEGLETQDLTDADLLEYFSIEPTVESMADTPFHAKTSGKHTHSHTAMGSQGGDSTHSHEHSHSNDASHGHHSSTHTVTTPVTPGLNLAAKIAQLRERQAATPEVERMTVMAMTASGEEATIEMAVRWDSELFDPLWRNEDGTMGKRGSFVSTLPSTDDFAMVAAGADLPQIVDDPGAAWHAILCVEGLHTDEEPAREIMPGACQFPDLPVSLRLQIHDEGGHWGAVTCGRIDEMDRTDMQGYNAISGLGVFGTDEHGQTAQLLVEEQTQRFISIDPRNVDMEIVEVVVSTSDGYYGDDDDDCLVEWWFRYTNLTIGAATIVATPALQQAVITLASVDLPETPIAVATAGTSTITASADAPAIDLARPPTAWFESPGFTTGDRRLIRQSDGYYACPLTVENGRVFGHVAYWGAEHTGFPGKRRNPPHSKTYAHFMTGAAHTAEGGTVAVGNLTMGCGHADTNLGWEETRAHYRAALGHYDGGYGAIQVANVVAGEDEFGIWVAGAICEDVSDKDVRKFETLGLSGDWRRIAGDLHFLACLAVPVPGFPISRIDVLTAAAAVVDAEATRYGVEQSEDGFVMSSLVAAGRVHRSSPEERLTQLEAALGVLLAERRADAERDSLLALVEG